MLADLHVGSVAMYRLDDLVVQVETPLERDGGTDEAIARPTVGASDGVLICRAVHLASSITGSARRSQGKDELPVARERFLDEN